MSFEPLGLAPALLSAVQTAGYTEPTSVQAAAIPMALAGQDLMVSSQTGSGKTAAFMLPALQRIVNAPANRGSGVQTLVLTPTRELAMQVADATRALGANLPGLRIAVVVGGMPYGAQLKALSKRVDVLVATPGRLIDHLQAKRVNLSTVQTLVLDEADRMLDMGFIEDIETIVASTPASRQTLLFSATLDGTIAGLARRMLRDPQRVEITNHRQRHTNITQSLLYADDNGHKMRLLDHLLRDSDMDQAIVFTSTKRGADELADRLADQGYAVAALHGDMNQRQRTRTLGLLQNGRLRVLVATDVAARGIDVQSITHAFNYDLPMQAEDYVHRIGRTGRAGRSGKAFTLAVHAERHKVRRIEHFIGQPIPSDVIEGLEPRQAARPGPAGGKGGKNKRFADRGRPNSNGYKPHGAGDRSGGFRAERPQPAHRPEHARHEGGSAIDRVAGAAFDRDQARPAIHAGDRPARNDRQSTWEPREQRSGYGKPRSAAPEGNQRYGERRESFSRDNRDAGGYQGRAERSDAPARRDWHAQDGDRARPSAARPAGKPDFAKRADSRPAKGFKARPAGPARSGASKRSTRTNAAPRQY